MTRIPMIFAALLTAAVPAFGADAGKGAKRASLENRQGKYLTLMGDLTSTYIPVLAPGAGLRAALFLTDSLLIEGAYTRSAASEFFGNQTLNLYMNYLSVHAKAFLGNSFFVDAGVATKLAAAKQADTLSAAADGSAAGPSPHSIEETVTTRGLEAAIGNRWQWRHFTIDGDWLGLYLPTSSSTTGGKVDPRYSVSDAQVFDGRVRDRTTKTAELFVRFGLGASF